MTAIVITCPDCTTRYRATADSIGADGRTVRCAKCSSTWFVPAPDVIDTLLADPDALALADNQSDDLQADIGPASSPEPTVIDEQPPLRAPRAPDRSLASGEVSDEALQAMSLSPRSVGADVMMRDHVDREKLMRRRRTIRFIWAVPLLLVILAAFIAFFNRQEIVNRFPTAASAYQLIGVEVMAGGLKIDPPQARTVLIDGAPVIRIESVVRNLTKTAKTVPQIELTLHDIDGVGLIQWYVDPNPSRIEARGRLVFTSEINDPPAGAVGLRYEFVDDEDLIAANG